MATYLTAKSKQLHFYLASLGFMAALLSAGIAVNGQIRTNWFDVNPSSSSLDNDDPNGSSGGRVQHLSAASDLSRVYAASEWGGLWTSFNQGLTWVKINTFTPQAMWDVKVDPRNNRRVYATSFYDGRSIGRIRNSRSGISISDDAGVTWRNAPLPTLPCQTATRVNEPSAWQIAINPSNPRLIFVGTNCGLARSLNGAETWTYVDPTPLDGTAEQIYAVIAHGDSIVDVIGDNGHFRSLNAGRTWSVTPASPLPGGLSSIAVSPAENNVLFATVSGGVNIFESDDAGLTWPSSLTLPPIRSQGRVPFLKTNQRANSSQFDLWYGDVRLFKTTATTPSTPVVGGTPRAPVNSWSNQHSGSHDDVADLLLDPRAQSDACPLLFANDGGVYRNTTANAPGCQSPSWDQAAITTHATWIWGFAGVPQNNNQHAIYYGLQDDGSFGSNQVNEGPSNPVPPWTNSDCCDIFSDAADPGGVAYLVGFFPSGRGFRLNRRGSGFSGGGEIPNYPSTGTFVNGFRSGTEVVNVSGNSYAVSVSDGVYFTDNIGAGSISWTALNTPNLPGSRVGTLKVARVNGPSSIYYHTGDGNPDGVNRLGRVFRHNTSSSGSWIQLPLPPGQIGITVYGVDPNDGNRLIVAATNGVNQSTMWRTDNYGASWTALPVLDNLMIGGGTFNNFINEAHTARGFPSYNNYNQPFMVDFDRNNGNNVVAGAADAGVFLTTDFGNNWRLITSPVNPTSTAPHIPKPIAAYFSPVRFNANSAAFDIWIGTRGAGVFKVLVETP